MIRSIVKEIDLTPVMAGEENILCETIYFGGGTPSILSTDELQLLLDSIRKKFKITADAEITLEANPDDITPARLQEWRKLGINRLSVGIQSFADDELRWMNRAHTAADSLKCIDQIKEAGFTDYSIDLIYGSPLLTDAAWQQHVSTVIEKGIPHISCYALTVEPKTALDKMINQKKKAPVDAEKQATQFLLLMDWMEAGGYEHYEISNFAKPGMRSKHNSSYWQGKHYFGFGPSAHAYDGISRKWNVANNALYIQSLQKDRLPFEEELLTTTQQLNEYIMTSLRTMEGVDTERIADLFGQNYREEILKAAEKYTRSHQLINTTTSLVLSKEGKLFADGIAADLFF